MEQGRYASTVDSALAEIAESRFDRIAAHVSDRPAGKRSADEILDRLDRTRTGPLHGESLAVNARYAALAGLRGRSRVSGGSVDAADRSRLAAVAVELARDVHSLEDRAAPDRVRGPPLRCRAPLRRRAGTSWPSIRDLVVDEWNHAHPVLAQ